MTQPYGVDIDRMDQSVELITQDQIKDRQNKLKLKIKAIKAGKTPKALRQLKRLLKNTLKIDTGVYFDNEADYSKAKDSINTPIKWNGVYGKPRMN